MTTTLYDLVHKFSYAEGIKSTVSSVYRTSTDVVAKLSSKVRRGKTDDSTQQDATETVIPKGQVTECLAKRLKPTYFEWTDNSSSSTVAITGSFYDWQVQIPMKRTSRKFATKIDLPKGRHEFKFIIDGVWKCSLEYPVVENIFGELNNYVDIQ